MTNEIKHRRQLLQGGITLLLAGLSPASLARSLTPNASAGPFYPDLKAEDDDSDLTRVKGQSQTALGQIAQLSGTIKDANGAPVRNARVEIWQCDYNGRYRHSSERSNRDIDHGFQGFGHSITDNSGRYNFKTIKPVAYPGRTPHIHFLVDVPGTGKLVSQLYVKGEAGNSSDFLYQRMSPEQQQLATTAFSPKGDESLSANFDIFVGSGNLR